MEHLAVERIDQRRAGRIGRGLQRAHRHNRIPIPPDEQHRQIDGAEALDNAPDLVTLDAKEAAVDAQH